MGEQVIWFLANVIGESSIDLKNQVLSKVYIIDGLEGMLKQMSKPNVDKSTQLSLADTLSWCCSVIAKKPPSQSPHGMLSGDEK